MPVVDTLRLKTRLSESGMPEPQAQVLVEELDEVLSEAITGQLATKDDMAAVKADIAAVKADVVAMKADIAAVKADVVGVKVELAELRGQIGKLTWLSGTLVVLQIAVLLKLLLP